MDNLIFCLNATIPIFLTLLLGAFFRKVGLFTPDFVKQVNRFVFQGALPVLLFQDLGTSDFAGLWDGKFVLFCFLATFFSIVISIVISFFLKDGSLKGEFVIIICLNILRRECFVNAVDLSFRHITNKHSSNSRPLFIGEIVLRKEVRKLNTAVKT